MQNMKRFVESGKSSKQNDGIEAEDLKRFTTTQTIRANLIGSKKNVWFHLSFKLGLRGRELHNKKDWHSNGHINGCYNFYNCIVTFTKQTILCLLFMITNVSGGTCYRFFSFHIFSCSMLENTMLPWSALMRNMLKLYSINMVFLSRII